MEWICVRHVMAPCLSRSVHQNIRGLHALNFGGLMLQDGMSASMVALSTPLAMTIGETTFEMQSYLDQFFPSLLLLRYVFLMYGCLKKGMKATGILLMTIAIALVGAFFGFLA